jgi:hypothetical protein
MQKNTLVLDLSNKKPKEISNFFKILISANKDLKKKGYSIKVKKNKKK